VLAFESYLRDGRALNYTQPALPAILCAPWRILRDLCGFDLFADDLGEAWDRWL